jgi:hypothetical protein
MAWRFLVAAIIEPKANQCPVCFCTSTHEESHCPCYLISPQTQITTQRIDEHLQRVSEAALCKLGMHREEVQDLFGNDTSTAQQVESKRSILRASIRRIHGMIVALPSQANSTTQGIAERIKRAKATELSKIASELNRQELQDLQAKAHRGVLFHSLVPSTPATFVKAAGMCSI